MAMFWLGFVLRRSPHVGRLNHSNGPENVRQSGPFRQRYCALYIVHLQAFSERQESVRYRPLRCPNPGSRAPRRARAQGTISVAASKWAGCTLPEEQAAPEETAIPSSSKVMTAVSAFMPSTPNNVVFGRRPAASPKMTACGEIALRPDSNRLRNASMCAASAAKWRCAAAAAAPKAAIPTKFSVPARRPRS
jgi:hypothetical protein